MRAQFGSTVVELITGDITDQTVDAIVNAANSALMVGGGVDGAIHRRGGPAIHQETRLKHPHGCPTGSAVPSGAGKLAARYVLHAVGPVYHDGKQGEPEQLAGAHRRCLELAVELGCRSIAFPAISTGVYGYPLAAAAAVAIDAVATFVEAGCPLELVRFVLYGEQAYQAYSSALERRRSG